MDNFLQILIYLVIIIAFLNSLFKKKDKEQPKGQSPDSRQQSGGYSTSGMNLNQNSNRDDYDVLKEFEGMFKMGTTSMTEKRKMESAIEKAEMRKIFDMEHTEDKEWHTEDKEWHSEEDEWHEESVGEHQLDQSWHKITPFKRTAHIDPIIEKEAKNFEHMLADLQNQDISVLTNLKENLHSIDSLKEYIVYSEILGKPKYLRR